MAVHIPVVVATRAAQVGARVGATAGKQAGKVGVKAGRTGARVARKVGGKTARVTGRRAASGARRGTSAARRGAGQARQPAGRGKKTGRGDKKSRDHRRDADRLDQGGDDDRRKSRRRGKLGTVGAAAAGARRQGRKQLGEAYTGSSKPASYTDMDKAGGKLARQGGRVARRATTAAPRAATALPRAYLNSFRPKIMRRRVRRLALLLLALFLLLPMCTAIVDDGDEQESQRAAEAAAALAIACDELEGNLAAFDPDDPDAADDSDDPGSGSPPGRFDPGGASPPPAPPAATASSDADIERLLAAIRTIESGSPEGDYNARASGSTASGAYQIIDTTWANYGGYPQAYQAPERVQDAKARQMVEQYLSEHDNSVEAVAIKWYTGSVPSSGSPLWDQVPSPSAGNTLTRREYVEKFMEAYSGSTTIDTAALGCQPELAGTGALGNPVCAGRVGDVLDDAGSAGRVGGLFDDAAGSGDDDEPGDSAASCVWGSTERYVPAGNTAKMQRALDEVIARFGRGEHGLGCLRPGDPRDHGKGRACDFMVAPVNTMPDARGEVHGDSMAQWLIDNADALEVSYIIWKQQIWHRTRDQGCGVREWCPMKDRGSIVQNHYDHVHLSIEP